MSFGEWQAKGVDRNSVVADPLFVDRPHGNLRLQAGSPCINAGDNSNALAGPDLLYDGILRQAGIIRCHSIEELYAHVRRNGHGPEDAQDLVQEFFARFLGQHSVRRADRSRPQCHCRQSHQRSPRRHWLGEQRDPGKSHRR